MSHCSLKKIKTPFCHQRLALQTRYCFHPLAIKMSPKVRCVQTQVETLILKDMYTHCVLNTCKKIIIITLIHYIHNYLHTHFGTHTNLHGGLRFLRHTSAHTNALSNTPSTERFNYCPLFPTLLPTAAR